MDEHESLVEAGYRHRIDAMKAYIQHLEHKVAGEGIERFWRHVSIIAEQVAW